MTSLSSPVLRRKFVLIPVSQESVLGDGGRNADALGLAWIVSLKVPLQVPSKNRLKRMA